jgi:hypothetical protein
MPVKLDGLRRIPAERVRSVLSILRILASSRLRVDARYLYKVGWHESVLRCMPVDRDGIAIPWFTYNAIEFLNSRIKKNMIVLEFGSGNSTLWWSRRVSRVVSCEQDKIWFDRMLPKMPRNVEYLHINLISDLYRAKTVPQIRDAFDIIVIDGRERVKCAVNSLHTLRNDGVIIWDNSDRERYREGFEKLLAQGFRRLDFQGFGPINSYEWCTSIFFRSANCLSICESSRQVHSSHPNSTPVNIFP